MEDDNPWMTKPGKGNKGGGRGRGRGRARGEAPGRGQQQEVRRPDSGQPRPPPQQVQQRRPESGQPRPARAQAQQQPGRPANGAGNPAGNVWGARPPAPGPAIVAPAPAPNQWRLPAPLRDDQPSQALQGQSRPASEASSQTQSRGGGNGHGNGAAAARVNSAAADFQRMDIGMMASRDPKPEGGATQGLGRGAPGSTARPVRDDDRVVTRPADCRDKRGTTGQVTQLLVNCFNLEQTHGRNAVYQYDVEFKPPVTSKEQRIGIVKSRSDIIGTISAFDGWVLFLPRVLTDNPTVFTVIKKFDNSPVEVTIRLRRELPATDPTCVQMMNVIFKRVLKMMGMERIGRDYFCPSLSVAVPQHGVEIWPGFDAKIRVFEHSTMLSIDLNHRVLRKATVLDVMYDLHQNNHQFQDRCIKEIVGQIVLTRYNNRTYRVDDIEWSQNPESTFETRNGPVSFVDYYCKHHNVEIRELGQPLLLSKLTAKDKRAGQTTDYLLVPELCYMTGLTERMRRDFRVMQDIAQHTRVNPTNRRERLEGFSQELVSHENAKQELANWGFSFAQGLTPVQARVLPPEQISQRDKVFSYRPGEADWDRNMRGQLLAFTPPMTNWAVLYPPNCRSQAQDFVNTLQRVAQPMGIPLGVPEQVQLVNDRNDTYVRSLRATIHEALVIIVCIVPGNQKDRYDAIKKTCCIHHAVNSQVILSRTLSKQQQLMSVCTKIALQMNCKIGGIGWTLKIPLPRTMICGMDTYHKRGSQSVGAFVASMNPSFTRYHSRSAFFSESQELHDNLKTMMTGSLQSFMEKNEGSLPNNVILYRDGVGDGQLDAVFQHEVKQIQDAFKEFLSPDKSPYRPSLAVIVVKKRIATRFFKPQGAQCLNPPPGTVVDDVVTNANWYDFFIISQSVRQGSVSPTHYNVIFNSMRGLTPDRLQQLTYKLCHLYVNWPGTIRVPAPCMYAHKLAYLVGDNLQATPSPHLRDFLFYL